MECTVRHPVSAIRADACRESADGPGKYQRGGHVGARAHNAASVSCTQGCPDQHAHCASDGVSRSLGLRTASVSPDSYRKESHAGTPGDTYSAKAGPTHTVQRTPTPTMI